MSSVNLGAFFVSAANTNVKSSIIPQEFVRGWPVISAAMVGIGLGMSPLPFYTIGVFIRPISEEFGWAPSKVLLALSVYTVFIVFMAPFIGMVTDRIGARKVALTSIVMFGISMMMQSLHTGSLTLYIALWAFIAIFGAGTLPITFTEALNKMGAQIQIYRECLGGNPCRFGQRNFNHSAVISGPTPLRGADIRVPDLRGGFSHVVAALAAEGTSNVSNVQLISRGYERFIDKLQDLGADFQIEG